MSFQVHKVGLGPNWAIDQYETQLCKPRDGIGRAHVYDCRTKAGYIMTVRFSYQTPNGNYIRGHSSGTACLLCYIVQTTKHCMPFHVNCLRRERGLTGGQKVQNSNCFRFFLSNFHSILKICGDAVHPNYTQVKMVKKQETWSSLRISYSREWMCSTPTSV